MGLYAPQPVSFVDVCTAWLIPKPIDHSSVPTSYRGSILIFQRLEAASCGGFATQVGRNGLENGASDDGIEGGANTHLHFIFAPRCPSFPMLSLCATPLQAHWAFQNLSYLPIQKREKKILNTQYHMILVPKEPKRPLQWYLTDLTPDNYFETSQHTNTAA